MDGWHTLNSVGGLMFRDELPDGPAIRNARWFLQESVWGCLWELHERFLKEPVSFEERYEMYPGVGVVGWVRAVA